MNSSIDNALYRTDLPVLLLYDVDPAWSQEHICNRINEVEPLINALKAIGHPVMDARLDKSDLSTVLKDHRPDEVIVFNCCEDVPGILHSCHLGARQLETFGFTFTGSDSASLLLSQDKRRVKRRLLKEKIPTPSWEALTSSIGILWNRFPAIVKPAFEHCSYGITRESVVQTHAELSRRVKEVLYTFRQPVIVEEFIDGREFHVGVIGNGSPCVLPPGEIDYSDFRDIHDRLCTYESNFDEDSLAYRLTAPKMACDLKETELCKLKDVVIRAYNAIGCRDYARMDIRLRDGIFYVLDVNPNADISPKTSLALGAEEMGFSYCQFGSILVNLAAQRHSHYSGNI